MPSLSFLTFADQPLEVHPRLQRHYHLNGHIPMLKRLSIKVVADPQACCLLWQDFSSGQGLFDTWEFREAFYHGYRPGLHFITLRYAAETVGLLPLQYEADKKGYFWFGSFWQEENKFFAKDPLFIPLLLAAAPAGSCLNAISADIPDWITKVIRFQPDEPKFILNLTGYKTADDYLSQLNKKKRYNLNRDQRIIRSMNPEIVYNRFDDFELLIDLAKKRFQQKGEETDWEDPRRVAAFRRVIESGKKQSGYRLRMISVKINGQPAAVDLIAICNGCYYPLKGGYDVDNFSGIGNFMNLLEIEDAIQLGMNKMDFLEIGYGWKDKWFESVPLLLYEK